MKLKVAHMIKVNFYLNWPSSYSVHDSHEPEDSFWKTIVTKCPNVEQRVE